MVAAYYGRKDHIWDPELTAMPLGWEAIRRSEW